MLNSDPVSSHRYDRELQTRAREAGQSVYQQWLRDEALYGSGVGSFWFMPPNTAPDRSIQYLSQRDWDIEIVDEGDRPVSYRITRKVARKEGPDGRV